MGNPLIIMTQDIFVLSLPSISLFGLILCSVPGLWVNQNLMTVLAITCTKKNAPRDRDVNYR